MKIIKIDEIETTLEAFADLAGLITPALYIKTGELNKLGEPFFRVDYLDPISSAWQYGPTFARRTLIGLIERGAWPKIA